MPSPVITHDRPDPNYYVNIIQHDDGNWESQQMPLDDATVTKPGGLSFTVSGLRSITIQKVNAFTTEYIIRHAPEYAQRNALYIITQGVAGQPLTDAQDMWNWINAVRAYNATLVSSIRSMTFDQLSTFTTPNAAWPAPPASLP